MIVCEDGDGVICVGQSSHAWISGQLARRWGNEEFARPEPFDEVCLGAEQHDVGMAEWDLEPELDPETGWPRNFMAMPLETHIRLWREAPRKALTQSPYAALVISMHGAALYAKRDTKEPDPERSELVRSFLAEQEAFQRDLLEKLDEDPERARRNQRLVWALDFLSLALLVQWEFDEVRAPTTPGRPDRDVKIAPESDGARTVRPWPFDERSIRVRCDGRRLTEKSRDDTELHERLAAAPWVTLEFELRRQEDA